MPAIVSVTATDIIKADKRRRSFHNFGSPDGSDPFEFFFGPDGPRRRGGDDDEDQKQLSGGTGFLIESDGYILTNNHVIEGADKVEVKVGDKDDYAAKVVGRDPATDLALLKIEGTRPFPTVRLGDSGPHPRGRMGHGDRRPAPVRQVRDRRRHLRQGPVRGPLPRDRESSRASSRPTRRSTSATRAARS